MANAWKNVNVADQSNGLTLFRSKSMPSYGGVVGTDIEGATAVSVINTGPNIMYVWCLGHHDDSAGSVTPDPAQSMPLLAGQSITFSVHESYASTTSVRWVAAFAGPGGSTTCGGGVVGRR